MTDADFDIYAADPQEIVCRWRITAVGHRPRDYMARDFLIGGFQKDGRVRRFHKMCADLPDWVLASVETLPPRERWQAQQFLILQYVHLKHLNHLIAQSPQELLPALQRAWKCPPYGVLVRWDGDPFPGIYKPCRQAKICPWCLAREVMDLFDRLADGPWGAPGAKLLLLAEATTGDEALDLADIEPDTGARVRWLRTEVGRQIRRQAIALGVDGGIVTFQVGPRRHSMSAWADGEMEAPIVRNGYEYRFAVLGEINGRRESLQLLSNGQGSAPFIQIGNAQVPLQITCRTGFQALRHTVVGSSFRYRGGANIERGAFTLPPWVIADAEQWAGYVEATRGLPLFTTFGTWRQPSPNREY